VSSQTKSFLTPEEYLEHERRAEHKNEYLHGEVFAMAGAGRRHALIITNLVRELSQKLKERPCEVYSSDLRLRVAPTGLYTYPDVMVVCGELEFADDQKDTLLNPTVIVEPPIEHCVRQPENRWLLAEFSGLAQNFSLQSIGCVLPLAEVYDKIEWSGEQVRTGS
jgi:hypothetical protein